MSYYYSKKLTDSFEVCIEKTTAALATEQFGILTQIDVSATLKTKLDVDFPKYTILGACNPAYALKGLNVENKMGIMLPCNVIVREDVDGTIEVAAVDPVASMLAIDNPELKEIASEVQEKLKRVMEQI